MPIAQLFRGDCRGVLIDFADNSIDSIVTDPPYELEFMGKTWDGTGVAYDVETWRQCLRVLKPGGHLLSFGGSRTYHRMACAIEDAGFDIRDQIMWIYGSGFPKSHNLDGDRKGWGTALKPSHEPICVARKPFTGTVAANVALYSTGAINIDGCRIATADKYSYPKGAGGNTFTVGGAVLVPSTAPVESNALGRWPANLIHDGSEEVLQAFPDAAGQLADVSDTAPSDKTSGIYGPMRRVGEPSRDIGNSGGVGFKMKPGARRLDSGSAARFFYCAKTSKADRNEGCEALPALPAGIADHTSGQHITRRDGGAPGPMSNSHPTVKPTDLMRYLCRLVTPPGGLVLDPFTGSGSTGKGAVLEGFNFVGCDLDSDDIYLSIARARIAHAGGVVI